MSIHINNCTINDTPISFNALVMTTHGSLAIPSDVFMTSLALTLVMKSVDNLVILTRDDVLIIRHLVDGPLRGNVPEELRARIHNMGVAAAKKLTTKICNTVDYVVDRVINETFKVTDKRAVDMIAEYFNVPLAKTDANLPRYLSRLFDRIIRGDMNWAILSTPTGYVSGAKVSGCNPMISEDDYDSSGDEMYI